MTDRIAFIGGTGIYNLDFFKNMEKVKVSTIYGEVVVRKTKVNNKEIFFMPRHGSKHSVPPHRINYRGNIAALKKSGVEKVIAAAAVGSLRREMPPGSLAVIDQFIDQTRGRQTTFYCGDNQPVVHTDFTEPYCPELRKLLISECNKAGYNFTGQGTYVTTEGPRFETPAEIRAYARLGGDLVGMTNVPEVVLAREAGLCYATVALITNYAAGISPDILSHEEVLEAMGVYGKKINQLFIACIDSAPEQTNCRCREAGKNLKL